MRKPVRGLLGAPYLVQNNISIEDLQESTCVYRGSTRYAARGFPADLNVAAALSFAGIGADRTVLEVWAAGARGRDDQLRGGGRGCAASYGPGGFHGSAAGAAADPAARRARSRENA